ncbi:MAG: hypothetical protein WD894_19500 [Pirellulales bacterium]
MTDTTFVAVVPPQAPVARQTTRAPAPAVRLPTAEEIQGEIQHVLNKQLNPDLMRWVDGYAQVGKRNMYLWKWVRQGVEVTTLSSVDPKLFDFACDTKVMGVVLDVLLDDIADRRGDARLLEQLLNVPFDAERARLTDVAPEDRAYAEYTLDLWQEIKRRTRLLPLFDQFATIWRYDYLQLFNGMRYSHMVNEDPALLNAAEHDLYSPHNMHIIVSSTVDLMCSPGFDRAELGRLRDAIWHAQFMGRIGNLITTWERELGDGDYTSGVYARALGEGDVTLEMLRAQDSEAIARAIRAGGHEDYFLARWGTLRQRLVELAPRVRTVDLNKLLVGYERLIRLHLGSRGYK